MERGNHIMMDDAELLRISGISQEELDAFRRSKPMRYCVGRMCVVCGDMIQPRTRHVRSLSGHRAHISCVC